MNKYIIEIKQCNILTGSTKSVDLEIEAIENKVVLMHTIGNLISNYKLSKNYILSSVTVNQTYTLF